MLRIGTFAAAAGLAVALSAVAPTSRAQGLPGAGGMPGGAPRGMFAMGGQSSPVMILLAPSVQKELKLTEEQKNKAYALAKTSGQKGRDLAQAMSFGGGNANPQAMMQATWKLRQENDQAIAGILNAKQKERLDQIVLQAEGPLAVARPEIAAKLRLNDNQNEYVQGIMMQMRRELFMAMRQGAAAGQFDPTQARAMATKLREGAVQEISKVIDRKQKAAFNKMLGEPFDVSKIESEAASADPTATSPADPAKPAGTPEAKDAPAGVDGQEKETTTTKESDRPAPRKKGRPRPGANP
jgi:hypothetical protein